MSKQQDTQQFIVLQVLSFDLTWGEEPIAQVDGFARISAHRCQKQQYRCRTLDFDPG